MEFTLGTQLPPDMKASIKHTLEVDKEGRKKALKGWIVWMKKIKDSGTMERSQAAYAKQPEHVARVQGHLDFEFLIEVGVRLGFDEASHPSFREYWEKGAPMNAGDLPSTGYFKARSKPLRTGERQAED